MDALDWNIKDFHAWLDGQAPDAVVGTSDNCTACPIATWRRETDGPVSVSADTIVFLADGRETPAPEWVEYFVHGIDEYHADEGAEEFEYREEPVTAYECLQVVEQIII